MPAAAKTPSDKLREPFPPGSVGLLPKPTKAENPKGKCNVCNGYHGLPAVHLDYVGHANVTDRLLTVDPEWTWTPFSVDERGLPALDRDGNLWINLTVLGVTRPGVGDGKNLKEKIGDALRNAAMRFGVALDLWSKDELESGNAEVKATASIPAQELTGTGGTTAPSSNPPPVMRSGGTNQGAGLGEAAAAAAAPPASTPPPSANPPAPRTPGSTAEDAPALPPQVEAIWKTGRVVLHWDDSSTLAEISDFLGKTVLNPEDLTFGEAKRVIPHLNSKKESK